MKWIQERLLGRAHAWKLPRELDAWYYDLVDKGSAQVIRLANVDIRQLGLRPALDFAMFGAERRLLPLRAIPRGNVDRAGRRETSGRNQATLRCFGEIDERRRCAR